MFIKERGLADLLFMDNWFISWKWCNLHLSSMIHSFNRKRIWSQSKDPLTLTWDKFRERMIDQSHTNFIPDETVHCVQVVQHCHVDNKFSFRENFGCKVNKSFSILDRWRIGQLGSMKSFLEISSITDSRQIVFSDKTMIRSLDTSHVLSWIFNRSYFLRENYG